MGDFSQPAVIDPLFGVGGGACALVLQPDLHHAARVFGGCQAFVGFGDRPGHGLLGIEILAGSQRVQEMAIVTVQGAGHDDGVDIFHVEQAAIVVEGLNVGNLAFRLVAAAAVDVGHGYEFDVGDGTNLTQ